MPGVGFFVHGDGGRVHVHSGYILDPKLLYCNIIIYYLVATHIDQNRLNSFRIIRLSYFWTWKDLEDPLKKLCPTSTVPANASAFGAVLDFTVFAVGGPQQMPGVGFLVYGDGG